MISKTGIKAAGILVLIVATLTVAGCTSVAGNEDAKNTINKTLVGHNMTYYSIAGIPMNHTIGQDDIVSIDPTTYNNASAWKVRVGTGLAWDLTMSSNGTEILYVDQLFRT